MKAVILAGGLGTRISEETQLKPKPMIEIGGQPILWHIMKMYAFHGVTDFIICCGYKGYQIKEYFANYFLHLSDVTIDMKSNEMAVHCRRAEPWSVTLIDTGEDTQTGGRLKRVASYLKEENEFFMTYGDGLGDIDIAASLDFHRNHGRAATVTAVYPPARFGALEVSDGLVVGFQEKPRGEGARVNGGFFVLSTSVLDLIADDSVVWERGPMESLARSRQLVPFLHDGFWQPMDTMRDRSLLERLWQEREAPWQVWK
ncbi:MAG: glucose-1-phosphate cytidylyltransferase [Haliea sp.]|nr:glucose-1-phosphate cytidylyltransferase [Haliea sp.]|tara:strand:- start:12100 stop:12873 length:774 start_codon:yes stop_codon:yes gene_type:complete